MYESGTPYSSKADLVLLVLFAYDYSPSHNAGHQPLNFCVHGMTGRLPVSRRETGDCLKEPFDRTAVGMPVLLGGRMFCTATLQSAP